MRIVIVLFLTTAFQTIAQPPPPPEPSTAPRFEGTNLPTPPMQNAPWIFPKTSLSTNYLSATRALFDRGLADPRGCDYREIEISVASVTGTWRPRDPSVETGRIKTHGWLLPSQSTQKFAICWNGLVYPALAVGSKADLETDIFNLVTNSIRWGTTPFEEVSTSPNSVLGIKACLLLRLGKTGQANSVWQAKVRYEQEARKSYYFTFTNAPSGIVLPESDPYLEWATEWIQPYYDRVAYSHMRRDDGMALASARALVRIQKAVEEEAERRGLKRRNRYGKVTAYFEFTEPLRSLLDDEERRLLKPKHPLVVEVGITNYPNQSQLINALIQDLDEVNANMWGGANCLWYGDKTVLALIAEGNAAVEPLLRVLEGSERGLTRFFQRPIQEPVVAALQGIMQTTFVDTWATTNELAAAEGNQNKITAAKMRAYWQKFKNVPLTERWYQTLACESAREEAWKDALDNILLPVTSFNCLPTVGQVPLRTYSNSLAPMRGESLRSKTNPSITELLLKHAERQPAPQPVSYITGQPVGLTPYYPVEVEWIDYAFKVGRWDSAASVPLLQTQMKRLIQGWEANLSNPVTGHWNRGDDICRDTLPQIVRLTLARAKAGDISGLEEYIQCLLNIPAGHYAKYGNADFFKPLWRYSEYPAVSNGTRATFNPLTSNLASRFDPTNGSRSIVIQGAQTPLCVLPQFQLLLLAALTNTTPLGSVKFERPDFARATLITSDQYVYDGKPDLSLCDPDKTVTFRVCDYIARQLVCWEGMPKIELYWREPFRDQAVAACRKQMQAAVSNSAILRLIPTRANPSGDPLLEAN